MSIMATRNIIIFGDPSIDRRFLLKLLGISVTRHFTVCPPCNVFETQTHSVTIGKHECKLYNTAGFQSDVSRLEPRKTMGNLYRFIRAFESSINLLIYVVHDQHSVNNIKMFYDSFCRRDVPIILVTSNSNPPSTFHLKPDDLPHFKAVLTLYDDPESDRASLREAIVAHIKGYHKDISPLVRFEITAIKCWELSERAAGWSIPKWRSALKATLMEDVFFSEQDAAAKSQVIVDQIKKQHFRNVIVFGDTGAGKTSVIKMLTDKVKVDTTKAASAGGSTFESSAYDVTINEHPYTFHDTVGLEDGTSISLSPEEALKALYQLIQKVEGGVSLLVYVHRGKIKPSQVQNYKLFSQVICKSMVPTVLVVTGLEEVDSKDAWWKANKGLYDEQHISTEYHACITSTKGKFNRKHQEFVYQDQYEESKTILKSLFLEAPLPKPWKIPSTPKWWKLLVVEVYNLFASELKWKRLVANETLYNDLVKIGGLEEDKAKEWANNLDGF